MISPAMALAGRPSHDPDDPQKGTLGDVLYADRTQPLVPEQEWVGLIHSIAAGDQRSLHALFERTHRLVFTLMLRVTNSRETAEELTLDVFHDVWGRASTYDVAGGSVLGWIMNQARSRAIDRVRYEQRKKRVNHHGDNPLPAADTSGPDGTFDLREQGRLLHDALSGLTAPERQAIETAFFSQLTYVEVAARLNQPLGTVKTRIRSGLAKLRQALSGTPKAP